MPNPSYINAGLASELRKAASIAIFASVLATASKAWSAQEICITPEPVATALSACIPLSALPDWLRKNVKRDAQGHASEDVLVRLGEGLHRLASPIVIDATAWRSGGRQLTIEGLGASKTVVSGAVTAPTATLPEGDRANKKLQQGVVGISLKNLGITPPEKLSEYRFGKSVLPDFELFSNGNRLPRSRWPNTGFGAVATVEELGGVRFTVRGQDVRRYATEPALMLGGYFAHDWADETLRAGAIDVSGVRFLQNLPSYGVKIGQRVWFENALSDIDTPGEWAYDPESQSIYVLPEANQASTNFEVSKSLEGIVFNKVWNVLVKDIGFTSFRDNAIRVDEGLDIALKGIHIRNSGGVGIRLNGRNVVANDLSVADTGAGGVSISGGNRITLSPGRVAVRNCTVERVGRLSKSYKVAVGIAGVGNEVSNCRLSDGPHAAILFHGNDHLIEGNLIERFVLETDDAGAIYTGQDWTERGTIIRGNFLRNLGMPKSKYGANAIYLDDQASGIIVKENLIINSHRGVMIGGGRDNKVEGNVFLGCSDGIYLDSRGTREIELRGALANPSLRKSFIDVNGAGPEYTARYPDLLANGTQALGHAGNNVANDNIFTECITSYTIKQPAQGAIKIGTTYIAQPIGLEDRTKSLTPQEFLLLRAKLTSSSESVTPREATKDIP
ncbi:right-handed parallel beta-helix repeat-containing protein [Rhodoferax sp. TS-BS-61-7]|uniref:right-handed parallel beta-helix repeat-containing protein n=1 Tax=Rhodoferax sp. TS-BS-61-7 TaxID=2094194 RepID=UPI001374EF64|nr:right-handed parallel beta-helix repeat-containing protein [Rhodoferax sp. TS-BS-61-7]